MSQTKSLLLLFYIVASTGSYAQIELWTGAGLDLGVPVSSGYQNNKNILKPKFQSVYNENAYLQLRFFKRLGLEGFVTQNTQSYKYEDISFYKSTGNKYEAVIKSKNHYLSYGFNLIYRQPITGSYVGIYTSAGFKKNFTGTDRASDIETFKLNSQEFEFVSSNFGKGNALAFELGAQIITDDEKNMITIGLQYNKGLSTMYQGDLTARRDGNVLYSDQVKSNLDYFGLTLKYHYRLFGYDRSEKLPKNDPDPVKVDNHAEYVHPSQRKVEVKDTIKVKTKKIVIAIYDPYRADHDKVSISINGKWILQNYEVTKEQYQFEVELYPGLNNLLFQAENLGDIPPNTATIFVIENGKKKKFDMSANLNTSQSLIIDYKP